jgi:hypothetical protein
MHTPAGVLRVEWLRDGPHRIGQQRRPLLQVCTLLLYDCTGLIVSACAALAFACWFVRASLATKDGSMIVCDCVCSARSCRSGRPMPSAALPCCNAGLTCCGRYWYALMPRVQSRNVVCWQRCVVFGVAHVVQHELNPRIYIVPHKELSLDSAQVRACCP